MANPSGSRWITFLLLALIAVMALEIGFLIFENRELRSLLDDVSRQFEPLTDGSLAPALTGQDVNGTEIAIKYGDGQPSTMLFCFSPSCDACEGNVSYWNSLYSTADRARLRCVGLCAGAAGDARTYVQTHGVKYPVISITDDRLWKTLHGEALPQTILIKPDGAVKRVWMGTLDSSQQEEISRIAAKDPAVDSTE